VHVWDIIKREQYFEKFVIGIFFLSVFHSTKCRFAILFLFVVCFRSSRCCGHNMYTLPKLLLRSTSRPSNLVSNGKGEGRREGKERRREGA
jgi:hypothetical protein